MWIDFAKECKTERRCEFEHVVKTTYMTEDLFSDNLNNLLNALASLQTIPSFISLKIDNFEKEGIFLHFGEGSSINDVNIFSWFLKPSSLPHVVILFLWVTKFSSLFDPSCPKIWWRRLRMTPCPFSFFLQAKMSIYLSFFLAKVSHEPTYAWLVGGKFL